MSRVGTPIAFSQLFSDTQLLSATAVCAQHTSRRTQATTRSRRIRLGLHPPPAPAAPISPPRAGATPSGLEYAAYLNRSSEPSVCARHASRRTQATTRSRRKRLSLHPPPAPAAPIGSPRAGATPSGSAPVVRRARAPCGVACAPDPLSFIAARSSLYARGRSSLRVARALKFPCALGTSRAALRTRHIALEATATAQRRWRANPAQAQRHPKWSAHAIGHLLYTHALPHPEHRHSTRSAHTARFELYAHCRSAHRARRVKAAESAPYSPSSARRMWLAVISTPTAAVSLAAACASRVLKPPMRLALPGSLDTSCPSLKRRTRRGVLSPPAPFHTRSIAPEACNAPYPTGLALPPGAGRESHAPSYPSRHISSNSATAQEVRFAGGGGIRMTSARSALGLALRSDVERVAEATPKRLDGGVVTRGGGCLETGGI
ncbi:hypothetical protein C8J57DRAFT_1495028 [Mycena rebaudengoi]|nr:hypothetical protein C8J57DRAFT_1495028 [Mycena rebaudengoi]